MNKESSKTETGQKKMRYRIRVFEGVELPDDVSTEYSDYDEACDALAEHVHAFDYDRYVRGSVYDIETCEDLDFFESVM